eukprot:s508_g20.t1
MEISVDRRDQARRSFSQSVKFLRNLSDQLAGEEMLSSKELTMLIDQTRTQPKRKFMRDRTSLLEGAVWAKLRRTINKDRLTVVSGTFHRCTHNAALLKKGCGGGTIIAPWSSIYGDEDISQSRLRRWLCRTSRGLASFAVCSSWDPARLLLLVEENRSGLLTDCPRRAAPLRTAPRKSQRQQASSPRPTPGTKRSAPTSGENSLGKGVDSLLQMAYNRRKVQVGAQQVLALEDASATGVNQDTQGLIARTLELESRFLAVWEHCAVLQEPAAPRGSKPPYDCPAVLCFRPGRSQAWWTRCAAPKASAFDSGTQGRKKERVTGSRYRAGLSACTDTGVEIPITRWDISVYYCEDPDEAQPFQSVVKHQSYVEGIELFDHKYFQIAINEARGMDPMQRHVLEVGAQNLFKMGTDLC